MKIARIFRFTSFAALSFALLACSDNMEMNKPTAMRTISISNVLDSRPLVESGSFQHEGASPVIMPGESIHIEFYAAKGQAITFASMYGFSNDLFFAPENPGIMLYDDEGNPIEGDVSSSIKLWDNGTRINQMPGENVMHPGEAESSPLPVTEIEGSDAQGNDYPAASALMKATLSYEGDSKFMLTISNHSDETSNPTPFSPGVWAISYIAGGTLLSEMPIYKAGEPSANGLTELAESGNNSILGEYIAGQTGIFTPLSPILVVVYRGIENPIYQTGTPDAGNGLKELAQTGNAQILANYRETLEGVESVYILPAENSTVLLPMINGEPGSMVSQELDIMPGDKLAFATMYGLSNDWFFASMGDIEAMQKGDVSKKIGLYDNGTAVNQYPGAGYNQAALGGSPEEESKPIEEVANPNEFTTLPEVDKMIKVTIQ